jgi:succinate-semialdehyde dehydrogenase / glutarate-semialdehyde dehydrogenase
MAYQSINPFDNHLEESFDEISDGQLEAKLAAAASCFVTWKQKGYAAPREDRWAGRRAAA